MKSRCSLILMLGLIAAFETSSSVGAEDSLTFDQALEISDRSGLGNDRLRQMLAFVDGLDAAGIEGALDQLVTRNPSGRHHELMRMLYARWTELDREAALAHASRQEGNQQFGALGSVISLWAEEDVDAAWEWFEKEGFKYERGNVALTILSHIAQDDPEKALTLFRESEAVQKTSFSNNPAFIYGTWALRDPAAAAAHWETETNYEIRRSAAMSIVSAWAEKDAEAAWKWIQGMSQNRERLPTARSFFTRMALEDREMAETFLKEVPPGKERESAIEATVSGLAMRTPDVAYAFIKEHPEDARNPNLVSMVFNYWVNLDAERAFEIAKSELESGPARKRALEYILQSVSNRDADRALAMLNEIGIEKNYQMAIGAVATAKARIDIDEALAWTAQLPEGGIRSEALSRVMSEWVEEAPQAAAAHALKADAADSSKTLLQNVLRGWGYQEPAGTVQWARENLDAETQKSVLPSLIGQWSDKDLKSASDWVTNLSADEDALRQACVAQLAYDWGQQDPAGGGAWLDALKAGPERDQAITNFSQRLFDSDPELALTWIGKMEDQRQRDRATEFAARRYLQSRPEKARKWIQSSTLDEKTKKNLLGEE